MLSQEEYKSATQIVQAALHQLGVKASAEDCINDAYILLFDQGKEINKESLIKAARRFYYSKDQQITKRSDLLLRMEHDKICVKCKELLPVGLFYLCTGKMGRESYSNYCKSCNKKLNKIYYKKNRIKLLEYSKLRYRLLTDELNKYPEIKIQLRAKQAKYQRDRYWLNPEKNRADKKVKYYLKQGFFNNIKPKIYYILPNNYVEKGNNFNPNFFNDQYKLALNIINGLRK